MWKIPISDTEYFTGFKYVANTLTKYSGGKYYPSGVTYTGLQLSFVPEDMSYRVDMQGNKIEAIAECAVPSDWFSGNAIIPHNDDYIVTGTVTYRVVGVDDYSRQPQFGIYYLYLKRDENAR